MSTLHLRIIFQVGMLIQIGTPIWKSRVQITFLAFTISILKGCLQDLQSICVILAAFKTYCTWNAPPIILNLIEPYSPDTLSLQAAKWSRKLASILGYEKEIAHTQSAIVSIIDRSPPLFFFEIEPEMDHPIQLKIAIYPSSKECGVYVTQNQQIMDLSLFPKMCFWGLPYYKR